MARLMLVAVGLLAVGSVGVTAREEAKAGDTSKMVGTWTVTACEKEGKKETAADIKDKKVKITRDTITCTDGSGKTEMACTYTVDDSAKPWAITMKCTEGEFKDKTIKGVVKLDGDTLRICHAKPDATTPTSFETKEGQCCVTLERAK